MTRRGGRVISRNTGACASQWPTIRMFGGFLQPPRAIDEYEAGVITRRLDKYERSYHLFGMPKGAQTRHSILDAALASASTVGLAGLSIGELAKGVKMSKSGLFAHFESKENLQIEVLRTAVHRFVTVVVAPALRKPRGEPRLRALFVNWLSWSSRSGLPGGCLFVSAASEFDDQPGAVRDYLASRQRDWLATLSRAASIAVEEGHFRRNLDCDQFAYDLYAILLTYHHFSRLLRMSGARKRALVSFEERLAASRR